MSKNLLYKISRIHLFFSVAILIATAPVFYFVTEQLYLNDADEALLLQKNEFVKFYLPEFKKKDIPIWNNFNRNVKIESNKFINADTLFFKKYYDKLSAEHEPYRVLNSPIIIEGTKYTLITRINLVESEDLISSIVSLFILIIILLLFGLYFINRKLSIDLWKPFYNTLEQIEQFEIDKLNKPRYLKTDIEEFNRLNQSIENLILKNTAIYQNQREFIENAAHELQTPLAVFQGKLDSLIQGTNNTKKQAKILSSLNDSVAKLKRLNKNLLLLSKIEKNSFSEIEEVIINEIIEKNFSFFEEQAKALNLTLNLDLRTTLSVKSNSILVEILINNLFLNAIQHNTLNGTINILITPNSLIIFNTGENNTLDKEKLFNRFSKSQISKHGNGLGLAIVKKIVSLNAWEISYSFSENKHTFLVIF